MNTLLRTSTPTRHSADSILSTGLVRLPQRTNVIYSKGLLIQYVAYTTFGNLVCGVTQLIQCAEMYTFSQVKSAQMSTSLTSLHSNITAVLLPFCNKYEKLSQAIELSIKCKQVVRKCPSQFQRVRFTMK